VLKGVPPGRAPKTGARREAVKKLFALYNAHGITSVADRNADRGALDLYLDLLKSQELTVRVKRGPRLQPAWQPRADRQGASTSCRARTSSAARPASAASG